MESAYRTLVERSCSERDAALRALSRWSLESLEEAGQALHECEECRATRGEAHPREADVACGCKSPPWAAAVALHTLRAFTAAPGSRSEFHLSFAARLQDRVRDDAFQQHWSLVAGLGALYRVDLGTARSLLRRCLEVFEDDADLLVALGASYEVEAWRLQRALFNRGDEGPTRTRQRREQTAERSRCWSEAEGFFEEALDQEPHHAEAHLRLGRVKLLLGRTDEGLERLRWVEEHAREPDLLYLAHLFLGRERARADQPEAALARYRAALEADPRGQAAAIATSHALLLGGDPEAAADVLERVLTARRGRSAADAWWRYPEGRPGQIEALLVGLHEEACR